MLLKNTLLHGFTRRVRLKNVTLNLVSPNKGGRAFESSAWNPIEGNRVQYSARLSSRDRGLGLPPRSRQ
jgi:hypothetical protein